MDITRYRVQHNDIMAGVGALRDLIQLGIAAHAEPIASHLAAMSTGIRAHLAAEDAVVYPALQRSADAGVVALGQRYQDEMSGLSQAYGEFARRWHLGASIARDPEGFRGEANVVFRALHERIQKENRELYPAAEAL